VASSPSIGLAFDLFSMNVAGPCRSDHYWPSPFGSASALVESATGGSHASVRGCRGLDCGVVRRRAPVGADGRGAPGPPALGFSAAAAAAELAREQQFEAMPTAKAAEADFDVMTAEPHHTGSPFQIKLADYVSEQFTSAGLAASRYESDRTGGLAGSPVVSPRDLRAGSIHRIRRENDSGCA
jgi:hypothetical protein